MDAACIRHDGCRLLRTPGFAEHEACFQIFEIELAQFLDGDRLVVEVPLFGWVISLSNAAQLDLGLPSGELWRPDAMKTDGVAT